MFMLKKLSLAIAAIVYTSGALAAPVSYTFDITLNASSSTDTILSEIGVTDASNSTVTVHFDDAASLLRADSFSNFEQARYLYTGLTFSLGGVVFDLGGSDYSVQAGDSTSPRSDVIQFRNVKSSFELQNGIYLRSALLTLSAPNPIEENGTPGPLTIDLIETFLSDAGLLSSFQVGFAYKLDPNSDTLQAVNLSASVNGIAPPSEVPLPASIPLLLVGLGALGVAGRARGRWTAG